MDCLKENYVLSNNGIKSLGLWPHGCLIFIHSCGSCLDSHSLGGSVTQISIVTVREKEKKNRLGQGNKPSLLQKSEFSRTVFLHLNWAQTDISRRGPRFSVAFQTSVYTTTTTKKMEKLWFVASWQLTLTAPWGLVVLGLWQNIGCVWFKSQQWSCLVVLEWIVSSGPGSVDIMYQT